MVAEVQLEDSHGGADTSIDELEAVNLQIVQEASQSTEQAYTAVEAPVAAEQEATELLAEALEDDANAEGSPDAVTEENLGDATKDVSMDQEGMTPMEKIMEALKAGLTELRTATLSRDDANKVEDMFMDFKRELYGAELRGRK